MTNKGILEILDDYGKRADQRKTVENLEQIKVNQEIEMARKSGDKVAEQRAMVKKAALEKQADFTNNMDALYYGIAIFLILGFCLLFFSAIAPVIFK